jgi:hypothetical protein
LLTFAHRKFKAIIEGARGEAQATLVRSEELSGSGAAQLGDCTGREPLLRQVESYASWRAVRAGEPQAVRQSDKRV